MLKYSEYEYKRIDLDDFKNKAIHLIENFNSLSSAEQQIKYIKKLEQIMGEWSTYASMASLEYSRDTFSKKNKEENEFYDNIQPEMQDISTQYADVLLKSPYRSDLEEEFGVHIFNLKEIEGKTFKPRIKNLLREKPIYPFQKNFKYNNAI